MAHPIDILERLAREGEPTIETRRLLATIPAAAREAIEAGDPAALSLLLSGRTTMACMVSLPDTDTPLPDAEPAQPDEEPQEDDLDATRAA